MYLLNLIQSQSRTDCQLRAPLLYPTSSGMFRLILRKYVQTAPTRKGHHDRFPKCITQYPALQGGLARLALGLLALCTGIHVVVVKNLRVPGKVSDCRTFRGECSHHDFPCVNGEIRIVERPVELLFRTRLVGGVVVGSKVWVGESLLSLDTLSRVEYEHVLEQVDGCDLSDMLLTSDEIYAPAGSAFLNLFARGWRSRLGSDCTKRNVWAC